MDETTGTNMTSLGDYTLSNILSNTLDSTSKKQYMSSNNVKDTKPAKEPSAIKGLKAPVSIVGEILFQPFKGD